MPGCLHVVATPIGNLDDLSSRGRRILGEVDIIAAEDTRRTAILLRRLGVDPRKTRSLRDQNEAQAAAQLLQELLAGREAALVADAGAPLISDPGFGLVRLCWKAGVPVLPVPGPSAITALLSVNPLPADQVRFIGFLPARKTARDKVLAELCHSPAAALFFESPHRIQATLASLGSLAEARQVFVGREMTKQFEHFYCGPPESVRAALVAANALRGEFTCLLESQRATASDTPEPASVTADQVMAALADELSPARAAAVMARLFGGNRADYYR